MSQSKRKSPGDGPFLGFGAELRAIWRGQFGDAFKNVRDKSPAEPISFDGQDAGKGRPRHPNPNSGELDHEP